MENYPIIQKLGGIPVVYEYLSQRIGIKSRDAIKQWYLRRSIPGHAMRELMALAEDQSIPYSVADFRLQPCGGNGVQEQQQHG